jgi:ketosteroid isomerase-like protein
MTHPNEELIRRGYDAFSAGDLETVLSIFDENIRWHVPGRSPLAGDYRGHDEVTGFFGTLIERSGGTFSVEVHDVLANDEHVVVLAVLRGERGGAPYAGMSAHIWHVADGKAVEFWTASTDQYAADEFWS